MRLVAPIMSGSTVIVGLNAALQKRFVLPDGERLVPGNVHRAAEVQTGVGGKGQDVAIALRSLQYTGPMQLCQFVGSGAEGDQVFQILRDMLSDDAIMPLTVRPFSHMRTCTSIVGTDTTTELVEPSGAITSTELGEIMERLRVSKRRSPVSALCFMGSMPPGCPASTYANMYTAVSDQNTLTVIDSVAGLEPLLQAIAEKKDRGSTILKVNAAELCRMAGVKKTNSEAGGVEPDELVQGVKQFLAKFRPGAVLALNAIAVTDGAHPAYMATLPVTEEENEFRLFRLQVAQLKQEETQKNKSSWASSSSIDAETSSRTLYPIGAGDAVAAGTLAAWKCLTDGPTATESVLPEEIRSVLAGNETPVSRAMLTSFAFGLACGSASCLQEENSVLKIEDAKNLFLAAGRPSFLSSHMII